MNGNATSDYKLSADKSEVTSGKYGILIQEPINTLTLKTSRVIQEILLTANYNKTLKAAPGLLELRRQELKQPRSIWNQRSKKTMGDLMIGADSRFRQTYFTTQDDNKAKADYDKAMARVQRLDKQLELKLNQVETQHKAVETEVESVDKDYF